MSSIPRDAPMIHFTGTANNPTLQLKRLVMPPLTSLFITYAPDDTISITGTEKQIERLINLALDSSRTNLNLNHPTHYTTQQELDDLRSMKKEWFGS